MKRLSIIIIILITSFSTWAQSKNPPVVSLDKMNVLYYGIDNKISIGSPMDFGQVKVSVVNGTITGEGYQRVVRPASLDKRTSIIVDINGNKTTHDFRVKSIPDPTIIIGNSSGEKIACVAFKSQTHVRCIIENFNYDVSDLKITGYIAYFTGAAFDEPSFRVVQGNSFAPVADLINRCVPGSIVLIDDVIVEMPDGSTRNIGGVVFNLY
jgi:hypothetical protein